MRVGVYVPGLGPVEGGGHTYVGEILGALSEARDARTHDVVAFGFAEHPPPAWDPSAYVSLAASLPVRAAGRLRRSAAAFVGQPGPSRVDRRFLSSEVDLLWCLAPGTPSFAVPYVTTIWDLQHRRQPVFPEVGADMEWLRREAWLSREIGQASVVIVGNEVGQEEVQRFYGVLAERIRLLPHPTPEFARRAGSSPNERGQDQDQILASYGLTPGYVFYPAQFWAHKNHVTLVRALRRVQDEHGLELELVFVGSDKDNEGFVRKVERDLGVADRVHHLGFVPQADLVPLYQAALALAYMSLFGPENLPPLEAFALGCPVIAADVPGSREQMGEAALLVPPTDDAALGDAIAKLQRGPELRARLIERGRERAAAFTVADYVQGMMRIADELEPVIRTWR